MGLSVAVLLETAFDNPRIRAHWLIGSLLLFYGDTINSRVVDLGMKYKIIRRSNITININIYCREDCGLFFSLSGNGVHIKEPKPQAAMSHELIFIVMFEE